MLPEKFQREKSLGDDVIIVWDSIGGALIFCLQSQQPASRL